MKKIISVILTLVLVLGICSFTLAVTDPKITQFEINGVNGVINDQAGTITVNLPYDPAGVAALTPTIVYSGGAPGNTVTCTPDTGVQQDFTNPVTYTVEDDDAANQVTKDYIVTVIMAPPTTGCAVLSMGVTGASSVLISNTDATTGTITILLPNRTDVSTLIAQTINTLTLSANATSLTAQGATLDLDDIYKNGGILEVTAQDGVTIRTYKIIIGFVSSSGSGYVPGGVPTVQQPTTTTPVQQPAPKNNASTTAKVKVMDGKKTYTTLAKEDGFTFTTIGGKNGKFLVVSLSGGSYGTVDMSKCEGTFSTISVMATVTSSTYTYDDMTTKSANRVEKLAKGDTVMIVGFYKGWVITEDGNYIPLSKVKLEVV